MGGVLNCARQLLGEWGASDLGLWLELFLLSVDPPLRRTPERLPLSLAHHGTPPSSTGHTSSGLTGKPWPTNVSSCLKRPARQNPCLRLSAAASTPPP